VIEPLGLSTQFYARTAELELCVFAMGRPRVQAGDGVRLSIDPAAVQVFDRTSGLRLN
jgi:multiple sugar transport system ATP-binding protein